MDWVGRLLTWLEPWLAYLLGLMQQGPLLALGVAVLAGVALGLSPVTYLFMPAVVGYVGGTKSITRRRDLLRRWLWLWYSIGAIALLLMGLRMIGLLYFSTPLLRPPDPMIGGRSVLSSYLLGLTFGLTGCPSCEPIRLAVLAAVAASTQPFMGALAMLALGLGQGLILVLAGTYFGTLPSLKRFVNHRMAINWLLGLLLLIAAAYFAWRALGNLLA
jgi:cytochrome c-type biogenesis protein